MTATAGGWAGYDRTPADNYSLSRRINKSPNTLDDPEKAMLKKMLTTPPVKKIDLHFPLGLEVTARNLKGVTIKDALDAIYKQYRKKVRSSSPCTHRRLIEGPYRGVIVRHISSLSNADNYIPHRRMTSLRPQS